MVEAEPWSSVRAELGGGPRWDARRAELSWVDTPAGLLHLGDRAVHIGLPVGAAAPLADGTGHVLAAGQGFALLDADGAVTVLEQPAPPADRMGDGACDPQGRFWAGSVAVDGRAGAGALYRLDTDATVTRVLSGLTAAAGLGWSPDGATTYTVDTGPGTVTAYDFDGLTGAIERPRTVLRGGSPAGLCVDDEGLLWVAFWGDWCVRRVSPDGDLVDEVEVPVSQPTGCCFGDDDRATLYVTTAWQGMGNPQREPDAGRVFRARPGVSGPPARPYGRPAVR